MSDGETAIRRLYRASFAALNAQDMPSLAVFYTEDAIQLPPNRPPLVGWKEIRSSLENELSGITLEASFEIMEVVIAGIWAYARGEYRTSVVPEAGGQRTVATGSWLDILSRQTDGTWRIARSTWSNHGRDREGT
ncbi:MAG: YybH family protein [Dehalococcoidia bacterium]